MTDYEALDKAIDEEFFGRDSGSDVDSLDDSSTESETNQTDTELGDSTPAPVDNTVDERHTVDEGRYKEAVRAMNEAQRELANYRKQDAERDNVIKQLQDEINQMKQSNTQSDDESDTEFDDYQQQTVKPLLKIIDDLKQQLAEVKGEISGVKTVSERYQQQEALTAKDQWRQAVKSAHPDIDELEQQNEFWDWAKVQPPIIQYALSQGTPADAIAALNLYRAEHNAPVPDTRTKPDKLEAARQASSPNVKSGGKPAGNKSTFTQKQIDKMSPEEFIRNEAAIDEAMARGEIY